MCCTWLAGYTGRENYVKIANLRTIAQRCWASMSSMHRQSENLVKQEYLLHISSQYGELDPLTAEIDWRVWDTPSYFNGYRVLVSLLQRRCSTEVNQTLHDVWPSPGLVHYIYTFGISCLLTEFCHVQNSLSVHLRAIALVSRAIS